MGQLIVVAGSLGVGKTSLLRALAERLNGVPYSELPSDYPYVEDMYADMGRWCFNNQLSFMIRKAEEHLQIHTSASLGIQDRGVEETHEVFSRAFGELGILSVRDYAVLDRTLSLIRPRLPPADLVIFMHAPVSFLVSRVVERDRSRESAVWPSLMDELDRQYERWYSELQTRRIRLDMTKIDFVARGDDFDAICSRINTMLIGRSHPGSEG